MNPELQTAADEEFSRHLILMFLTGLSAPALLLATVVIADRLTDGDFFAAAAGWPLLLTAFGAFLVAAALILRWLQRDLEYSIRKDVRLGSRVPSRHRVILEIFVAQITKNRRTLGRVVALSNAIEYAGALLLLVGSVFGVVIWMELSPDFGQ